MKNPRKYGEPPYSVVLVHGGPGAPGEMAPVARELSQKCGVLEPLQTKNSIDSQVEELNQQIMENSKTPVVLIGWSWGAWLSYLLAAKFPKLVKKLILVSSGPFEAEYAKSIMPTRLSHLNPKDNERVKVIVNMLQKHSATDNNLQEFGDLVFKADSYSPIPNNREKIRVQADIYESVWKEADELRKSGKLLECGKLITCPVVAIHGDYDPHPADGVRVPLTNKMKDFRFILLEHCGHTPWKEKEAKDEFYEILNRELKGSR